jgi:hypothetical protein
MEKGPKRTRKKKAAKSTGRSVAKRGEPPFGSLKISKITDLYHRVYATGLLSKTTSE